MEELKMKKLVLNFIGVDSWSRPVFEDEMERCTKIRIVTMAKLHCVPYVVDSKVNQIPQLNTLKNIKM